MPSYALVLGSGGARTAYQAGVLAYLGREFPESAPGYLVANGAGAINAGMLAGNGEAWPTATRELVKVWTARSPRGVFTPRPLWSLITQLIRYTPSEEQSLLDPSPQRRELERLLRHRNGVLAGVQEAIRDKWLDGLAVATTDYRRLRSVTWVQGDDMDDWSHPRRTARSTTLTIDHIMASAALPLVYPAVQIQEEWHGGGIGTLHPIAPALRWGTDRILAISTRGDQVREAPVNAYPSTLRVASILSNTLILDTLDADAATLDRIDDLSRHVPSPDRGGLEPVDTLVIRPSVDLSRVAEAAKPSVGDALGTVLQYLHSEGATLPDLLSLLLYDEDYIRRLLLLGFEDARQLHTEIKAFLRPASAS